MTRTAENYLANAESDAKETVDNFIDGIVEQLVDDGKASDDLNNDYPGGDAWHHESHVDKWYSLHDAVQLIDQLAEFEETDSGLWEGQQPKEAINTCAAFTYGNAVYNEWRKLIEQINKEASDIIDEYNGEEAKLEEAIDAARREAEKKQAELDGLPERKKAALRKMIEELI